MTRKKSVFSGLCIVVFLWLTSAFASSNSFGEVVQGLKDFKDGKVNISYVQEKIAGFLGVAENMSFNVRLNRLVKVTPANKSLKKLWYIQACVDEDDSRINSVRKG